MFGLCLLFLKMILQIHKKKFNLFLSETRTYKYVTQKKKQ